ncbi:MAG TPA: AzlD domain-containing protein [Alphaproteobacteria bacterium]|nr:AzlD domain-containing protein [Alphaproteobacteria bacterium]
MEADLLALTEWWSPLLILAMGVATYATRAGGLVLIKRMRLSPFVETWLGQIPGAVFIALVAPMVLRAGPPGWIAAALTLAAARLWGNFLAAMAVGTVAIALLRALWPAA